MPTQAKHTAAPTPAAPAPVPAAPTLLSVAQAWQARNIKPRRDRDGYPIADATLYRVSGERVAEYRESDHGGSAAWYSFDDQRHAASLEEFNALARLYFSAAHPGDTNDYGMSAALLMEDLINFARDLKAFERKEKTGVVFVAPGMKPGTYGTYPVRGVHRSVIRTWIERKYPDAIYFAADPTAFTIRLTPPKPTHESHEE